MFFIVKFAASAFLIVLVSEVAKKMDRLGALISALPLITLSVMIWMYLDNAPKDKIANHSLYTFWYVIPTLPMFLLMPWLLSKNVNFWFCLLCCVVLTVVSFVITSLVARFFGINLLT